MTRHQFELETRNSRGQSSALAEHDSDIIDQPDIAEPCGYAAAHVFGEVCRVYRLERFLIGKTEVFQPELTRGFDLLFGPEQQLIDRYVGDVVAHIKKCPGDQIGRASCRERV